MPKVRSVAAFTALFVFVALGVFAGGLRGAEFSDEAAALPFPPDASELEFVAWTGDINFNSRSPLKSLAAFYLKEMAQRGWELDASDVDIDDDSIELNFKHGAATLEARFSQSSKEVRVRIDTRGLKFSGADDPAKLAAAGVPMPRAALYLQKELPLPESAQKVQYGAEGVMLKSTLGLQEAFEYFSGRIKAKGFRESRRPIVTDTRRYTEFSQGTIQLSVNVFTDDVGSRIVLGYENSQKQSAVKPLPAVASLPLTIPGVAETPTEPVATTPVDVAGNKGSAVVKFGGKQYTFPHAACFQTKDRGDYATMVVFSSKPIPLNKMQAMATKEDDFSFFDLYESATPDYLSLQLGKYLSFSFSVPGVGVANSIDESVDEMKIADGRVKGTFKMPPKEVLSRQFSFTATIDAAVITPTTRISGPADPVATSTDPVSGDWPFSLPEGSEDIRREGSRFRKTYHALVDMPPAEAAAFYRKELPTKGWKAVDGASSDGTLHFANDSMQLSAAFEPQGEKTSIEIVTRDAALAKKEGVLPEAGKGRLILANAHRVEVVYTIGKSDYRLKAGRGAKDFKEALNYSIPPGTYKIVVKIPGQPEQTERIDLTEGTSWAIVALPTGGYLPIQLY
ncbi:MAG: hypothetical protein RIC55_31855 [Pirellulaceae bacterium]